MSRQNRPQRAIRGPQSALTDFLASHNISATEIRSQFERRQREAEQEANQDEEQNGQDEPQNGYTDTAASAGVTAASTRRRRSARSANIQDSDEEEDAAAAAKEAKRKKEQAKKIEKIKASKKKKRNGADSDDDEEDIVDALRKASGPLPGQMENCEMCSKRFTVTPYSRAGPNGGLLCTRCSKEAEKLDPKPVKKKPRVSGGPVGQRRKIQSNILDGTYRLGAKSLMSLCIDNLAKNVDLAEDLGDMPPKVVDKIARLFSKRRLLNSTTLNLFLQSSFDEVRIYDGAKLSSQDIIRIFQTAPGLKDLKLRSAVQFKDEVMAYLLDRDNIALENLYLSGANLLSSEMWNKFLVEKGKSLHSLRVYYTDRHFGDDTLALLGEHCPSLDRLKVEHNQAVSAAGVRELAKIKCLAHLSLQLHKEVHADDYVHVIRAIGQNLKSLSLAMVPELDNTILDALNANCRSLVKLRLTDSEHMTDDGFVRLFTDWKNPGLEFIDLQKCRHLDSNKPRANEHNVGLCSNGFKALMAHSGKTLRKLNVHACRHISREAFEEIFAENKIYPELKHLEVSFIEEVDDYVVGCIFRSCPNLYELNVFGCMKVKDARVPRGKVLVGVPNALGMTIEGDDD